MINKNNIIISLFCGFLLTGCSNVKNLEITPENNIINKESALQVRDIQIRTFENTTKENLMNAIVNTLLDDGYYVTTIDSKIGIISAKNDKNNVELNLVALVKETKDGNHLVRFSINAVDKSLAFKSYIIISDETIYRYLFDRLRKSLFLNDEFYNNKEEKPKASKIKTENSKESKILVREIFQKTTLKEKTTPKKIEKKAKSCKTTSSEKKESFYTEYSVEFLKTLNKELAFNEFKKLKGSNLDVRIHNFYEYKVVRLGRFKSKKDAEKNLNDLSKTYKNLRIVSFQKKY